MTDDDRVEAIKAWLQTDGLALELRVARDFIKVGYANVQQSARYVDPDDGKVREIDIVVDYNRMLPNAGVLVVIECKGAPGSWVVTGAWPPKGQNPYGDIDYTSSRIASRHAKKLLTDIADTRMEHDLHMYPPFDRASSDFYGFGLKMKPDAKQLPDQAYDALMKVTKAAHFFATRLDETEHPESIVAHPVIVVRGSLFEAFLSSDGGEIDVTPAERSAVLAPSPKRDGTLVWVDIVRESHLNAFAEDLARGTEVLFTYVHNRLIVDRSG